MKRLAFFLFCSCALAQIPAPIIGSSDPPKTPVDSPGAGTYSSTQSVTIADATATYILYTLDGSTPACPATGTLYTGAFNISTTTTLKAIGCIGGTGGGVLTSVYTISGGGITFVQANLAHTAAAAFTIHQSFSTQPVGGHNITVACMYGNNNAVSTVSVADSCTGNSYTPVVKQPATGSNVTGVWIFRAPSVNTCSPFTVTCTYDGGPVPLLVMYETSGDTSVTDGTNGAANSGLSTVTAGSISTSQAADLLFSACVFASAGYNIGMAAGSGYTLPTGVYPIGSFEQGGASDYQAGGMEYQITSSTGTFTGSMTQTPNTISAQCAQVAFK
jgi:hypothetical protein